MPVPPATWTSAIIEWHCNALETSLHDEIQALVKQRNPYVRGEGVLQRLAPDLNGSLYRYDIENIFETLDAACLGSGLRRLVDGAWILGITRMPSEIVAKQWTSVKWQKRQMFWIARGQLITSLLKQYGLEDLQDSSLAPKPIATRLRAAKRVKVLRSWLAIRFQILKRDNYRCRMCGASPKDGEHIRLEVDHITARSKGGTNDPSNLWALCFACNRGKGTKDL